MSLDKGKQLQLGELRVLITGSREWTDRELIRKTLENTLNYFLKIAPFSCADDVTLVSGANPRGADRIGEEEAAKLGMRVEKHPADWETHGRAAGSIRNQKMLDTGIDLVIAFPTESSKGTWDCVNRAKKDKHKPTIVIKKPTP